MSYAEKLYTCTCLDPQTTCDLSGWSLIEYIIFCHIMWWIFYYFLLLTTKQSEEWCCRFLTFFHGCLISYSALKDAYVNKSPIDFQTTPLSETKKYYLSYMVSYFLFDFGWIHFFGNETWVIYVHHIASIVIIVNLLARNYGGAGVAYGAAGLELTNPCLQLRWFLRTHGHYNKPIHTITELLFIISFFALRMIGGTILAYRAIVLSDTDFVTKVSFVSIYGISLVLMWQILTFVKKKYLVFGHQANIYLIQSRMSISPYFQRRTLERHDSRITENDAEELSTSDSKKQTGSETSTSQHLSRRTSERRESKITENNEYNNASISDLKKQIKSEIRTSSYFQSRTFEGLESRITQNNEYNDSEKLSISDSRKQIKSEMRTSPYFQSRTFEGVESRIIENNEYYDGEKISISDSRKQIKSETRTSPYFQSRTFEGVESRIIENNEYNDAEKLSISDIKKEIKSENEIKTENISRKSDESEKNA